MKTRQSKMLRTAILALGLLVIAPLASFAGVAVSVGVAAPGPGYSWVPGYYNYVPAAGYVWAPGYWALPPFVGAAWIAPHWGWYGGHRFFYRGAWGRGPSFGVGFHGGVVRGGGFRGGFARGGFHGGGFHGGGSHGGGSHGTAHHR
jgi:hypothetical protein